MQDLGDGFLVIDPEGERRHADDDVLSMALIHRKNYSAGLLKSVTRRFVVWVPSALPLPERLEMVNHIGKGKADPLAGLIDRLSELLFQRAKETLADGQSVLGEGWTLQEDTLSLRVKEEFLTCPLADLTAVGLVDNNVCVWRTGQEEAFARVPRKSANAFLLERLLEEELAQRPKPTSSPEDTGLGRIIFERRPNKGSTLVVATVGVVFLVVAGLIGAIEGLNQFPWLLGCLGGSGLMLFLGLYLRRATFRCHQFGVHQESLFGNRTLRYADVAAFSYSAVRQFHNGAYCGTNFSLSFEPMPECAGQRISHTVSLPHADQELESLRDQVSRIIADRMAAQLQAQKPVAWTKSLQFLPNGIEYQRRSWLGRQEPLFIPFQEIHSYQIRQGRFFLWVRLQKKPVVKVPMTQSNFFPGYFLLMSLVPLESSDSDEMA